MPSLPSIFFRMPVLAPSLASMTITESRWNCQGRRRRKAVQKRGTHNPRNSAEAQAQTGQHTPHNALHAGHATNEPFQNPTWTPTRSRRRLAYPGDPCCIFPGLFSGSPAQAIGPDSPTPQISPRSPRRRRTLREYGNPSLFIPGLLRPQASGFEVQRYSRNIVDAKAVRMDIYC